MRPQRLRERHSMPDSDLHRDDVLLNCRVCELLSASPCAYALHGRPALQKPGDRVAGWQRGGRLHPDDHDKPAEC